MSLDNKGIKEREQIEWINCAKFMAVFAVLIDHTNHILYENYDIVYASFYSVSLFVIISGYLCFESDSRYNRSYLQTVYKSCKRIVLAYLIATLIYFVVKYHAFALRLFLSALIRFNISGPLYYVALYVQLMIANKVVYKVLVHGEKYNKINEILYDILVGAIILIIASITTNYTNILDIYGGGGKVLGGTYLFLFYIGMILNKYKVFVDVNKKRIAIIFAASAVGYVCWWRVMCNGYQDVIDSKVPFGGGYNPPSITFSVLAFFMLFLCFSFFTICSWNEYTKYISKVFGWLGRHTLYIFLYHKLWLDFFLVEYVPVNNIHIKRILFYSVMIFASIVLEYVMLFIKQKSMGVLKK